MEHTINPNLQRVQTAENVLNWALAFMAIGLIFAAWGSYLGMLMAPYIPYTVMIIWALVLKLSLLFTVKKWSKKEWLNIALFTIFTTLGWITLYPILAMSLASSAIAGIAMQAFMASAGIFMVLAVLGWTTKKDLTKLWGILMAALITIIIVWIINLFFFSSMVSFITSCASVLIFAGFTAYDIGQIKNWGYDNAIEAWINLYLDFINLFVNLFYILLSLFGND